MAIFSVFSVLAWRPGRPWRTSCPVLAGIPLLSLGPREAGWAGRTHRPWFAGKALHRLASGTLRSGGAGGSGRARRAGDGRRSADGCAGVVRVQLELQVVDEALDVAQDSHERRGEVRRDRHPRLTRIVCGRLGIGVGRLLLQHGLDDRLDHGGPTDNGRGGEGVYQAAVLGVDAGQHSPIIAEGIACSTGGGRVHGLCAARKLCELAEATGFPLGGGWLGCLDVSVFGHVRCLFYRCALGEKRKFVLLLHPCFIGIYVRIQVVHA